MSWDETVPENDDQVRGFGGVVRSHKTELRAGLATHFFWDDASGVSAGEPRLDTSSNATGSCRAFFGAASEVSAFRDGGLFVTSDSSRLIGLTSASSVLLGSTRAVQWRSSGATLSAITLSDIRVLVQSGIEESLDDETANISFTTAYNGIPDVSIGQQFAPSANIASNLGRMGISDITTGGFTIVVETPVSLSKCRWRSVGTVSLT